MEKLTIKELAPYLPFKLQWTFDGSDNAHEVMGIDITDFGVHLFSPYGDYGKCRIDEGKPILRPLTQLTEEIDNNPNNLTYSSYLKLWTKEDIDYCKGNPLGMCYETVQQLLEWHFDVFGLIDKGLALPIDGKEVKP